MAAMDLSTKQEVIGVQNRYEYAHHIFKPKKTFEETDIQGNITLFNTLKTDANSTQDHDSSSLLQVKCPNENKFEVDNDLFSYSSFKKAMDLRTHNRTLDGVRRTIFDDAEYFAKHYRYQLLPITLEPVDETVIQFEHNYSLMSLNSESEPEESFSRTMDYSQVKEKNYKRRKTKFGDGSDVEEALVCDEFDPAANGFHSSPTLDKEDESLRAEEEENASENLEIDNSVAVQPLDLSAAPLVQEEKTDLNLRESPSSIVENEEIAQLDSDKENVNSELNGVLVTITRPDEKENYQPCDLFLNDIARLVPRLIGKDCLEVDILDRTCDRHDEFRKHRLYYVISESTWRLFQKTNERVILTNDQSLGQPIRKVEKDERPSYLVFDQFSLAKCLADYCQEIGGCFEYTCVEEGREEAGLRTEGEEETAERVPEIERDVENVGEKMAEEENVVASQKEEEGERMGETKPEEDEREREEGTKPEEEEMERVGETKPEEEERERVGETNPEGEERERVGETKPEEEERERVGETKPGEEEMEREGETKPEEEEMERTGETKPEEEEMERVGETKPEEEEMETVGETKPEEEERERVEETKPEEEGKERVGETKPEEEEMERTGETKPEEEEMERVGETKPEEKEMERGGETKPKEEEDEQVSQKQNDITDFVGTTSEELVEKLEKTKQDSSAVDDSTQKESTLPKGEKATEEVVPTPESEESAPEKAYETKQKPPDQDRETNNEETETPKHIGPETEVIIKGKNNTKKQSRGTKRKRKSSIQRKPKISRTTPRQQSVPESETSQKSDKPVSRKGKRESIPAKEEPPNKLTKPSVPEMPYRTRSGKVLQEVKTNKPTAKKKENAGSNKGKKTETKGKGQRTTKVEVKKPEETGRSLRSHKTTQWKEKVQVWPKTKARKR